MATASDGGNGIGFDDGSLTVAQVRTPSTPFESDMNPLSDFNFSGRGETVTVKDVEEIVEAVKSSFSKFIETQRDFLSRQQKNSSETENVQNSSSNSENSQISSYSDTSKEADDTKKSLTIDDVFGIIKSIRQKEHDFANETFENETLKTDSKNEILEKLSSSNINFINNDSFEISEKLVKGNSEEVSQEEYGKIENQKSETGFANDMFMSFEDYLNNKLEETYRKIDEQETKISSELSNIVSAHSQNLLTTIDDDRRRNGASEKLETTVSNNIDFKNHISQNEDSEKEENVEKSDLVNRNFENDDFELHFANMMQETERLLSSVNNREIVGDTIPKNLANKENNIISDNFSKEIDENIKILRLNLDSMDNEIHRIFETGVVKSAVETAIQNSTLQSLATNGIEGLSSPMMNKINESFGEMIRSMGNSSKDISKDTFAISRPSEGNTSKNKIENVSEDKSSMSDYDVENFVKDAKNEFLRSFGDDASYEKPNDINSSNDVNVATDTLKETSSDSFVPMLHEDVVKSFDDILDKISKSTELEPNKETSEFSSFEETLSSNPDSKAITVDNLPDGEDMYNRKFDSYDEAMSYAVSMFQGINERIASKNASPTENTSESETLNTLNPSSASMGVMEKMTRRVISETTHSNDDVTTKKKGDDGSAFVAQNMSNIEGMANMICKEISKGVNYLGSRFDSMEQSLAGVGNSNGSEAETIVVPISTEGFDTKRIG